MKKVAFIAICVVGLLGFTSCRSTAPCGLSQQTKQNQLDYQQTEVLVSEVVSE